VSVDYGAKGCRCWRSEDYNFWDDRTHGEWLPNAHCPHHGLLADYTGGRTDTGAYRVILDPPLPDDKAEDARTGDAYTHAPGCQPQDCCGDPSAHTGFGACQALWGEHDHVADRDGRLVCHLAPDVDPVPDLPSRASVYCYTCGQQRFGSDDLELTSWLVSHPHDTTEEERRGVAVRAAAAVRRAWNWVGRRVYGDAWDHPWI